MRESSNVTAAIHIARDVVQYVAAKVLEVTRKIVAVVLELTRKMTLLLSNVTRPPPPSPFMQRGEQNYIYGIHF